MSNNKKQNEMEREFDALTKLFKFLTDNVNNPRNNAILAQELSRYLMATEIEKSIDNANERIKQENN
jgi:hypothetical protein